MLGAEQSRINAGKAIVSVKITSANTALARAMPSACAIRRSLHRLFDRHSVISTKTVQTTAKTANTPSAQYAAGWATSDADDGVSGPAAVDLSDTGGKAAIGTSASRKPAADPAITGTLKIIASEATRFLSTSVSARTSPSGESAR